MLASPVRMIMGGAVESVPVEAVEVAAPGAEDATKKEDCVLPSPAAPEGAACSGCGDLTAAGAFESDLPRAIFSHAVTASRAIIIGPTMLSFMASLCQCWIQLTHSVSGTGARCPSFHDALARGKFHDALARGKFPITRSSSNDS